MKSLDGKVVVITGAGSGIGRALAVEAAQRGARLALADWNAEALAETEKLSGAAHCCTRTVDVRSEEDVQAFARDVEEKLGGAHVVVNNAGVSLSDMVGSMQRSDFEWVFDVNFWGVVRGTEAFLPQLMTKDEAHVVNVSSVFGIIAVPSQSAYNASKFAVRGFTEALRQELEDTHVRVTCVHPGGVRTNIVRNGRHLRDSDGAATGVDDLAAQFERIAKTTPEAAAAQIWQGVLANRSRVLVGRDARLIDFMQRLFPESYPLLMRRAMKALKGRSARPASMPEAGR